MNIGAKLGSVIKKVPAVALMFSTAAGVTGCAGATRVVSDGFTSAVSSVANRVGGLRDVVRGSFMKGQIKKFSLTKDGLPQGRGTSGTENMVATLYPDQMKMEIMPVAKPGENPRGASTLKSSLGYNDATTKIDSVGVYFDRKTGEARRGYVVTDVAGKKDRTPVDVTCLKDSETTNFMRGLRDLIVGETEAMQVNQPQTKAKRPAAKKATAKQAKRYTR